VNITFFSNFFCLTKIYKFFMTKRENIVPTNYSVQFFLSIAKFVSKTKNLQGSNIIPNNTLCCIPVYSTSYHRTENFIT